MALAVLSPKVLKFLKVHTTFFSRVTSMSWGFFSVAWQLPMMTFPLGSTCSVVTQASVMPGRSF